MDRIGFSATVGIMVWWWTTLVGALLLAIAFAVRPAQLLIPIGTYAHNSQSIAASQLHSSGGKDTS